MPRDIQLPDELAAQVEARIANTEFETVDEYVRFVLGAVVEESEPPEESAHERTDDVEQRLESLGYL